jgi:hypothetical protein
MKTMGLLLLTAVATPSVSLANECPLQGTWKSDAARTLADIAANNAMAPRALNVYSDDVFGHMIHEWSCSELRAWFDHEERPEPVQYLIQAQTSESLLVTFPNGDESDLTLILEGECYKIRFDGRKYHEHFCPVQLP